MGTLKNTIRYNSGAGYATLYYTTEYDAKTNQSTVTLTGFLYANGTISADLTDIFASISVKAADNVESIGTAETNGGTPNPDTITVQHGPDAGKKSVVISMYVQATFQSSASGSTNSVTVATGVRQGIGYIDNGSAVEQYGAYIEDGTAYSLYAPYIDNGSGWEAE